MSWAPMTTPLVQPSDRPADAQSLLEHSQWMRRLARRLVQGDERADELAQDTWLRLLQRPPRAEGPLRGWIATVMRNLVKSQGRGTGRRLERERTAAQPEAQPSSLDLLGRAALQRELVQAVLDLSEPYRTAILLRYFEERTPGAIARAQGVPLATVKTRLARGLALLRARLERTRGPGGESVLAGLVVLGEPFVLPPSLPLTLLAVNAKIAIVVLLVLLVAGISYTLFGPEEPTSPGSALAAAPARDAGETLAPAPSITAPPAPATQREGVSEEAGHAAGSAPVATAPAGAARLRGSVVDLDGRPVADVAVARHADQGTVSPTDAEARLDAVLARTDAAGLFELAEPVTNGRLFVRDARWTTVLAGMPVDARSGQESLIVVAPRMELAGVVVDDAGNPLAGARLEFELPQGFRARLTRVLDFSASMAWSVGTDELGRFRVEAAPVVEEGRVRARAEGFLLHEDPAPLASRHDLVIVLTRPGADASLLSGLVLDAQGSPVEDAYVAMGLESTTSDARGRFQFQLDDPDSFNRMASEHGLPVDAGHLCAVKPGYLPAELAAPERDEQGHPRWPAPPVLRLGPPPLAIEGEVVDEQGEPLPGIDVWLVDPTFFGGLRDPSDPDPFPRFAHVENVLAEVEDGWHKVETDGDGRFRIDGLLERDYTVAALDPATLLRVEEQHVPAGEMHARIRMTGKVFATLSGRIVDGRGDPVRGAAVFPMCDAFETKLAGETVSTHHATVRGVQTDAEGVFELARVPEDLVYLRIEAPDTIPLEWGRQVEGGLRTMIGEDAGKLVIAVERRCHFQVELTVVDEADELGMLDASGQVLVISEFLGSGRRDTERHPLTNGRSNTLAVGGSAAVLVLYKGGVELRRVPVRLAPGEPTILRP